MEDVLDVYQRPYDARFPVVCLDEGSKQVVSSKQPDLPMKPGQSRREDYEYERKGFCSVFLACEPLAGKHMVQVRARRTALDWAEFARELIEEKYAEAEKIVLVMDNLNTHTPASFYEAFAPEVARRLREKLEIHHTPVHGSWLNMAEIDLSVLARQALHERAGSVEQVRERVERWQERRNRTHATLHWQFTTQDARIKLASLYPQLTHEA